MTSQKSKAYDFAAAILGGTPIPVTPAPEPIVENDPTKREPKMCEICTRSFTRPIGSKITLCAGAVCGSRAPRSVKVPRVGSSSIRTLHFGAPRSAESL